MPRIHPDTILCVLLVAVFCAVVAFDQYTTAQADANPIIYGMTP